MFRRLNKETRAAKIEIKNRTFRDECFKAQITARFFTKNKPRIANKSINSINIKIRITNKFIT